MKTQLFVISLFAFTMLFSAEAMAQRGRRSVDVRPQQRFVERPVERHQRPQKAMQEYCLLIPDLTQEQEAKIGELRLKQIEQNTRHRNKMDELRARKRSLITRTDEGDVNQVIDEMTALRNAQLKENVAHRQAIREILTEEQRIVFDSQTMRRPGGRATMGRPGARSSHMGRGRW